MTNKVVKKGVIESMAILNRVKELRAAMGINQQELGSLVNVSRQTISLIERGDYNPSITLALKISHVFQKNVEEVFMLTEDADASPPSVHLWVCWSYTGSKQPLL